MGDAEASADALPPGALGDTETLSVNDALAETVVLGVTSPEPEVDDDAQTDPEAEARTESDALLDCASDELGVEEPEGDGDVLDDLAPEAVAVAPGD